MDMHPRRRALEGPRQPLQLPDFVEDDDLLGDVAVALPPSPAGPSETLVAVTSAHGLVRMHQSIPSDARDMLTQLLQRKAFAVHGSWADLFSLEMSLESILVLEQQGILFTRQSELCELEISMDLRSVDVKAALLPHEPRLALHTLRHVPVAMLSKLEMAAHLMLCGFVPVRDPGDMLLRGSVRLEFDEGALGMGRHYLEALMLREVIFGKAGVLPGIVHGARDVYYKSLIKLKDLTRIAAQSPTEIRDMGHKPYLAFLEKSQLYMIETRAPAAEAEAMEDGVVDASDVEAWGAGHNLTDEK